VRHVPSIMTPATPNGYVVELAAPGVKISQPTNRPFFLCPETLFSQIACICQKIFVTLQPQSFEPI